VATSSSSEEGKEGGEGLAAVETLVALGRTTRGLGAFFWLLTTSTHMAVSAQATYEFPNLVVVRQKG
jgi:hypothetical protein